jgi:hypothetical protein
MTCFDEEPSLSDELWFHCERLKKENDALTKERDAWKEFAKQMKALFTIEALFREVYSGDEVENIIAVAKKTCGIEGEE